MINIISHDQWFKSYTEPNVFLKIDTEKPRLYRKVEDASFYGGHQIHYCGVNSKLAHEWLKKHFDV